jgi:general secretion pathway protein E
MLQSVSGLLGAAPEKTATSLLEMLLQAQLLTEEQAQQVRQIQGRNGNESVIAVLLEENLVPPEQLALVASLHMGAAFVNLKKQEADDKAVEILPEWVCRKYKVIPVKITDDSLQVAMEDPGDIQAVDELAALSKRRIEPVLAFSEDILEAINRSYRIGGEIATQLQRMSPTSEQGAEVALANAAAEAIAEAPMVRAVDLLIRQAARDRASDIHIEPEENELRVRFRIDGILHEGMTLPKTVHAALISRIKIISGMNIAETRRPQDGQITMNDGGRELDIRVATAPTVNGEMVVMRILDKTFALLELSELGFLADTLKSYENLLKLPHGMILSSGPTGAGKTTTL